MVILDYIIQYLPTVIAIIMECGIVKYAFNLLSKIKDTSEMKEVLEQNKKLIAELREAKKLNKELLTKIDRIQRGTDNNE